jgi:hypothetical protein
VVREPELSETHTGHARRGQGPRRQVVPGDRPVYFHVVTDGATGAVTDAQIAGQIDVLNNTFAGGEGGADTGFRFTLAGITRSDNASWFLRQPGRRRRGQP